MRGVLALGLLAGCIDFADAQAEFCAEHPGECFDAGQRDGGADSGVEDAGPPRLLTGPELAGFPQVGQTLAVSTGTWSSLLPLTYSFRWERCGGDGGGCVTVLTGDAGYTLGMTDLGARVRATVEASSAAGGGSGLTPPTAPVRPLPRLLFVTGFEHGVTNAPLNSLLFTETQNVQMLAGAARSGRLGLRTQGVSYIRSALLPGVTQTAMRFALRVQQPVPAGTSFEVLAFEGADVPTVLELQGNPNGAIDVRLKHNTVAGSTSSVRLQVGTWAVIRCRADATDVRCRVDDGPDFSSTRVNGFGRVRLGTVTAAAPQLDFDDVAGSDLATEHPLGDGETWGFAPTAEGAHVRPQRFVCGDDVARGPPDGGSARLISDWPPQTAPAHWVGQGVSDDGAYLEYEVADLPADQRAPTAVRIVIAASAGSAGTQRLIFLEANGVSGPLFPPAGAVEYLAFGYPLDLTGLPWSRDSFNGLTVRMGKSPDAGNLPRIEALLFEAELPR